MTVGRMGLYAKRGQIKSLQTAQNVCDAQIDDDRRAVNHPKEKYSASHSISLYPRKRLLKQVFKDI